MNFLIERNYNAWNNRSILQSLLSANSLLIVLRTLAAFQFPCNSSPAFYTPAFVTDRAAFSTPSFSVVPHSSVISEAASTDWTDLTKRNNTGKCTIQYNSTKTETAKHVKRNKLLCSYPDLIASCDQERAGSSYRSWLIRRTGPVSSDVTRNSGSLQKLSDESPPSRAKAPLLCSTPFDIWRGGPPGRRTNRPTYSKCQAARRPSPPLPITTLGLETRWA